MATLTREQYLDEFKKRANAINESKEIAIAFYNEIGVLTPTGRISKNYKPESTVTKIRIIKKQ